jgi:hypothetical protein
MGITGAAELISASASPTYSRALGEHGLMSDKAFFVALDMPRDLICAGVKEESA